MYRHILSSACSRAIRALLILLAFSASWGALGFAQDGNAEATEAYREWDLERAEGVWLEALESRELSSAERGRLLYNLGNVSFRRNEPHLAVGYYTASLRHRPRNTDTWANLELARSEAGFEPRDRGDLVATLNRLVESFTLAESEWLVLGAMFLLFILLLGEAVIGGRLFKRLAWAGLGLVLLCAVPWIVHLDRQGGDPVLLIGEQSIALFSEPRREATVVSEVRAGSELQRLDALPGWIEVRTPAGFGAWIEEDRAFRLVR